MADVVLLVRALTIQRDSSPLAVARDLSDIPEDLDRRGGSRGLRASCRPARPSECSLSGVLAACRLGTTGALVRVGGMLHAVRDSGDTRRRRSDGSLARGPGPGAEEVYILVWRWLDHAELRSEGSLWVMAVTSTWRRGQGHTGHRDRGALQLNGLGRQANLPPGRGSPAEPGSDRFLRQHEHAGTGTADPRRSEAGWWGQARTVSWGWACLMARSKSSDRGVGCVPGYCDLGGTSAPRRISSVGDVVGERSSTDFGMDFGSSVNSGSIYTEVRYHYIWGSDVRGVRDRRRR